MVFEKPTSRILKIAYDFEEFHGIPYVFWASDESQNPIIAASWDSTSYDCRKEFYLVLYQGIVGAQYKLWKYDLDELFVYMSGFYLII